LGSLKIKSIFNGLRGSNRTKKRENGVQTSIVDTFRKFEVYLFHIQEILVHAQSIYNSLENFTLAIFNKNIAETDGYNSLEYLREFMFGWKLAYFYSRTS